MGLLLLSIAYFDIRQVKQLQFYSQMCRTKAWSAEALLFMHMGILFNLIQIGVIRSIHFMWICNFTLLENEIKCLIITTVTKWDLFPIFKHCKIRKMLQGFQVSFEHFKRDFYDVPLLTFLSNSNSSWKRPKEQKIAIQRVFRISSYPLMGAGPIHLSL